MKKTLVWTFLVLLISISFIYLLNANELSGQDKYAYIWNINGNGHKGILQYNLDGNKLKGSIYGNKIEGFQVGRHIVFYRTCKDNQIWTGWIWNGDGEHGPTIAGTFSHRGENSFPWSGLSQ